jgi:tripartite-type tricarboxylate transporter receptor subunit TctC
MTSRTTLGWIAGTCVGLAVVATSMTAQAADAYPSKPVRLLVGFAAGGANDLVGRTVATRLASRLGRTVVVENRPGAGGNVATEQVARSAPDGYTMLLGSVSSIAMGPALYKSVPYDPLKDFATVTNAVSVPTLLSVHPSMSVRSLKEFVALAKRRPGAIDVGCPGFGSISHLAGELFKRTADIDFSLIPYKGGALALTDVMGGQIGAMMSVMSTTAPHVKAGRLVGLGITGAKRSPALPEVPTIAEAGYPGYAADGWMGFFFPAGTSAEIVTRMFRDIQAVLETPEVRAQLDAVGMQIDPGKSPDAFMALVRTDVAKWKKVVQDAKIQLQ